MSLIGFFHQDLHPTQPQYFYCYNDLDSISIVTMLAGHQNQKTQRMHASIDSWSVYLSVGWIACSRSAVSKNFWV